MRARRLFFCVLAAVLTVSALAACSDSDDGNGSSSETTEGGANEDTPVVTEAPPGADENAVTITGAEYRFIVQGKVHAGGLARLKFKNAGKEEHLATFARMKGDATVAELRSALQAGDPTATAKVADLAPTLMGTPQLLSAGATTVVYTSLLKEGRYGIVCVVPAKDGQAHFAKGMVSELRVEGEGTSTMTAPTPDVEITLREKAITAPPTLAAGTRTVKVTNAGAKPHELTVVRPADGKKLDDVYAYFRSRFTGTGGDAEAPGSVVGGTTPIPPKQSVIVTLDVQAGGYSVFCGYQEPNEAQSHFQLGERADFTVT